MAPTQDLIPRFGIFKSIFNVCISFSGGRDRLVRIPTLTHERPRIINLTHGSKDRALGLGQREVAKILLILVRSLEGD